MKTLILILIWTVPFSAYSKPAVKYYLKNFVHLEIPAEYYCMPEVPLEKGIAKYYDKNKKLVQKVPCNKNQKVDGVLENYLPSGELIESIGFENGVQTGPYRRFGAKGKIRQETYYEQGKPHGIHRLFNETGKLVELGQYEYGKRDGKYTRHYLKEGLKLVFTYDKGQLIAEPKYEYSDATQALFLAASSGHIGTIRSLVKKGARVNGTHRWGTPLILASQNGQTAAILALIKAGADVNMVDQNTGMTPLMAAARFGRLDSLTTLLENKAKINQKNIREGNTALTFAAIHGHSSIVLKLIEKGANTRARNKKGKTARTLAKKSGQKDIAQILLNPQNALKTFRNRQNEHYCTNYPIDLNASRNKRKEVKAWIQKCKSFDHNKRRRSKALRAAAQHGHYELVKYLILQGAEPNLTSVSGPSALIFSSMNGHAKISRLLLASGADIDHQDNFGYTALIWAAERGHTEILEHLMVLGANLNIKNKDGKSALFQAVEAGNSHSVQLLLARGAELTRAKDGETPMDVAKREGYKDIQRILATLKQ